LKPISKSSEEDNETGKLDEAEEVVGVIFPADEDATLPLYPGDASLSLASVRRSAIAELAGPALEFPGVIERMMLPKFLGRLEAE
jgi:hypothetical protein